MSSGYVIPIDPRDFNRFPGYDPRDDHLNEVDEEEGDEDEEEELELTEEAINYLKGQDFHERIEPLLDRIPEKEADIIQLYFLNEKRQADIAEIFGVTQAAISYRLARGIRRLKFLLDIISVSEEDLRRDLPKVFEDPIDVDILVGMWSITCQSKVAKVLNLTQGRVRHRFFKAVTLLQEAAGDDDTFEPYSKVFNLLSHKNFNILSEVKLPQWEGRGLDECF